MTAPFVPQIALYRNWLAEHRGLTFANYEEMRQWSVRDLDGFWRSIWDYYDLQSPTPFAAVITERKMPGAVWFPGAQVNYARQVSRHVDAADAAGPRSSAVARTASFARRAGRSCGARPLPSHCISKKKASSPATASPPICPT